RALEILGEAKGNYKVVHPNIHVNMSQSTNDAVPTAVHVALLHSIDRLIVILEKLVTSLNEKAAEFDSVIKMGRTHLQDAVPIRIGKDCKAYETVLTRDIKRISRLREALVEVNLGATAVGTGLNADPKYVKK